MKKVIGIIGELASGKDAVTKYISEKLDIPSQQISDQLKKIARDKNIEINRNNLIALGQSISEQYGDSYLAECAVKNSDSDILLIGGMRQLGQITYFQKNSNFILISIEASAEIRFNRMNTRRKEGDPSTLEEFILIEQKDDGKGCQKISECMKLASYTIQNESSEELLYEELDKILEII